MQVKVFLIMLLSATADRIRQDLTDLNVEVMDNPTGATWKIKGAS